MLMSVFTDRRNKLLDSLPEDTIAIIPGAGLLGRNSDVTHPFRQDSTFQYFTDFNEPEAVLVLRKIGKSQESILFVQPKDELAEIWNGRRAGPEGVVRDFGVERGENIDQFEKVLTELFLDAKHIAYELGVKPDYDAKIITIARKHWKAPRRVRTGPDLWLDLAAFVVDMRMIKDSADLEILKSSTNAASEGHKIGMRSVQAGLLEYQLQAAIEFGFRAHGGKGNAYNSIVAGGDNANILHYDVNSDVLNDGDLVLVDAGCEIGCMASDVTRTYPVSGRFTEAQADIYDLVLKSQVAAIEMVKPGANIDELHKKVIEVLSQGLIDLGFFDKSLEDVIKSGDFQKFFMHGTSHWLGLDVHDVGRYGTKAEPLPLGPGMVFTIEPGLYIGKNNEDAPAKYRGIGIRIEDDILVTEDGWLNLTEGCPKTREDIEAVMSEPGLEMPKL
jgi:Xaa-Pro aminopeptidase